MKSFFQNLDLYKAIILGSLVLLPAVGFWAYHLDGQIEKGRVALENATKSRGDLVEIGNILEITAELYTRRKS